MTIGPPSQLLRLVIAVAFGLAFLSCVRKTDSARNDPPVVPEESLEVALAIPLSPEVAAALNGISEQGDVVADVFLNGELVSEGVRGGVRGGLRGGVRGAAHGGVRGSPQRQVEEAAGDVALSFEVKLLLPKRSAKDGDNQLRARVRPGQHQEVALVEVTASVKIRVVPAPGAEVGQDAATGTFSIEVEESPINLNEVELPDLDGDGVSTLVEVATALALPAVEGTKKITLDQAVLIAANPDLENPTVEQVQAAFDILAKDLAEKIKEDFKQAGVTAPAEATIEFQQVDLTPPDVSVTAAPVAVKPGDGIKLTFLCNEPFCTFRCALDPPADEFKPCVSPHAVATADLSEGAHTVAVHASDFLGNRTRSPKTAAFQVDATPPETTLAKAPVALGIATVASFEFTSNDPTALFLCQTDVGTPTPCTSPLKIEGVKDGKHTFSVYAVDQVGNRDPTPSTHEWTVDATPPDTTLTKTPAAKTDQTGETFEFASTETQAVFECSLDSGPWTTCKSPHSLSNLAAGSHSFIVRAVDAAGNLDATPAEYGWIIDLTPATLVWDQGQWDVNLWGP